MRSRQVGTLMIGAALLVGVGCGGSETDTTRESSGESSSIVSTSSPADQPVSASSTLSAGTVSSIAAASTASTAPTSSTITPSTAATTATTRKSTGNTPAAPASSTSTQSSAGASTSSAPGTTNSSSSTSPAADRPTFVVDADAATVPTLNVRKGASVKITVRSSTSLDLHLHGYDIELSGTDVTMAFTADLSGTFDLTRHPDHAVLAHLIVT